MKKTERTLKNELTAKYQHLIVEKDILFPRDWAEKEGLIYTRNGFIRKESLAEYKAISRSIKQL